MPPTTVLPTAITGPIGFSAVYSLEQVRGSTVLTVSTDMSITALILTTVTTDRYRRAGQHVSTTSRQTRRGMGVATLAPLPIRGKLSTRSPDIAAMADPEGTTRAQWFVRSGWNDRG
jgi:hypothetical protein